MRFYRSLLLVLVFLAIIRVSICILLLQLLISAFSNALGRSFLSVETELILFQKPKQAFTFRCSLLLLILDFVGCFHLMIALLVLIFVAKKVQIETRLKCRSFRCDIKIIEIIASFHPETAKPQKRHKRAAIFLVCK